MKTRNHIFAGVIFGALCAGCGSGPTTSTHPEAAPPPVDPWVLKTTNGTDPTPALLWNGLCGFRFGRDGSVASQPFFSIEEYDQGGEEKIRSLPSPAPNGFLVDGKPLPITGEYSQSLDMKTSELQTTWKSGDLSVSCLTVLHPEKRLLAERWTLIGLGKEHALDFDLGTVGHLGKESLLSTDFTFGPSHSRGKILAVQSLGTTVTVEVTIGLGYSPAFLKKGTQPHDGPSNSTRLSLPVVTAFSQVEQEAAAVWKQLWKTDIEIDGPVADQQAVRSWLFYLRSSISPTGGMSVSPFGLSNQTYNGHVFWDADMWVFPSLALLAPKEARAISIYRLEHLASARQNAQREGKQGCKYPWESSVTGAETVIGPSSKEVHITGDVAWSLHQAAALGLVDQKQADSVRTSAGQYYQSISKPENGELCLKDVMSPDENHTGDNDLFTNLLAEWCSGATKPTFHIPKDSKGLLTYDNDPVKSYKQAAAVLSIYPLQSPLAESQAKSMMERFAGKSIKNGPAMSDSVYGVIWARMGESDKAYRAWKESWEPFTRQPLLLFSEKRTKPTTYFTTGAAGSLQTVLFGFLGFRLDSSQEPSAAWSRRLLGESWLSIRPNLPKEWKSVKLKDFTVLGSPFTLTVKHRPNGPDAAEVIQGD